MSQSLSRRQAAVLGLVVLAALVLGGYGVARIADRQGLWADTTEIAVGFPEAHDLTPGTPVRVRGVEAGQVVGVEYPDHDGPGAEVTIRMKLHSRYAGRLYADATAAVHSSGVFGAKVISINPGNPATGPLAGGRLRGLPPFNMDEAVAQLRDTAAEVKGLAADVKATSAEARGLIKDVRESDGTLAKLIKDDDLYHDLKDIAGDAKTLVKRADRAVGTVEGEMTNLKGFVADGRDTLRSVKQGTDAVARMPVIRGYVEDPAALLVRPAHRRDRLTYNTVHLFEPGTAIPLEAGKVHLSAIANWLRCVKDSNAEVVIVTFHDPNDKSQTPASALELTRKQSEAVVAYLKAEGVHKLGWTTRRKITPLGMGTNPSPVVEKESLPPSHLEALVFTP